MWAAVAPIPATPTADGDLRSAAAPRRSGNADVFDGAGPGFVAHLGAPMLQLARSLALVSLAAAAGCAAPIRSTISPGALMQAVETAEAERDGLSP
ncbi:hypothetical protein L6R52_41450, partial [Myxococcota bacterium]|nr:hypothetical protein [Myxococcota bacterium]